MKYEIVRGKAKKYVKSKQYLIKIVVQMKSLRMMQKVFLVIVYTQFWNSSLKLQLRILKKKHNVSLHLIKL